MRINKHFLILSSLFIGISLLLFAIFRKYLPLFLHDTVIFCQNMVKAIAFGLPNNLGITFITFLLLIVLTILTRILIIFIRIRRMKVNLHKNIISKNKHFFLVNSSEPFAFCFGLVNPKVYISSKLNSLLTEKELKAVIAHEKYHLKNHDTITLLLARIFEILFPYFPIITDLVKHYRIESELLADQSAILASGGNKDLINVLEKLLKYKPQLSYLGIPAIAEIDLLEPRINKLIDNKHFIKTYKRKNIFVSLASFIILICLAIIPISTAEIHLKDGDSVILCVDKNMSTYYTL